MATKKNGLIQETNSDGKVIKEAEWLDGKKHGWENTYDAEGKYVKRTQYENGNKILEEEYYKGLITKRTPFANGKKEGVVVEYVNGVKTSETMFANGKKDGDVREYYPENGALKSEKIYINGKRDFTFERSYYPSGNRLLIKSKTDEVQYMLDNDKPTCKVYYDQNGSIIQRELYYTNGQVAEIEDWTVDEKNDFFDPNGTPIDDTTFYRKYQDELNCPEDMKFRRDFDENGDNENSNGALNDEDSVLNEEENKLCAEYEKSIRDVIEVAKSLDLLGLLPEGAVKVKLHEVLERYEALKTEYDQMMDKF